MSLDTESLSTLSSADRVNTIAKHLKSIPLAQRAGVMKTVQRGLREHEAARLTYNWSLHARDSQLPPKGDWDTWMILAGRGFGKTRTGAEWVRDQVENKQAHRIALVARTLDEAQSVMIRAVQAKAHLAQRCARTRILQPRARPAQRPTVRRRMVRRARLMGVPEGESGIVNISPPWDKPIYEPSKRKLTWPNGAHALAFSSHEPDQLRGPQFDAAWCDELASWEYPSQTWDNLTFALRLGRRPRSVVTTTPKSIELVRSLPNRPGVQVTRGSTYENQDNLPPAYFNQLIEQYDGTRIGQQEIYAELIDEDEDAIWKREWIEKARLSSHPPVARIVVAIDPAMSTKPNSSETGIVVVGADMRRKHAYVLADESGKLTPNSWARRAAHLFDKFNATRIVAEDNVGGDMVKSTLKNAVDRTLPYKGIKARRGKYIRAEPVAALYEQGRVHHVGRFPQLEDQMCTWTPDLGPSNSPDRVDALVHAITELIIDRNPVKIWI